MCKVNFILETIFHAFFSQNISLRLRKLEKMPSQSGLKRIQEEQVYAGGVLSAQIKHYMWD